MLLWRIQRHKLRRILLTFLVPTLLSRILLLRHKKQASQCWANKLFRLWAQLLSTMLKTLLPLQFSQEHQRRSYSFFSNPLEEWRPLKIRPKRDQMGFQLLSPLLQQWEKPWSSIVWGMLHHSSLWSCLWMWSKAQVWPWRRQLVSWVLSRFLCRNPWLLPPPSNSLLRRKARCSHRTLRRAKFVLWSYQLVGYKM